MTKETRSDVWGAGESYDLYMGRWSMLVARQFLAWLSAPPGLRWLDVGCGTGALAGTVLAECEPASVVGVEPSPGFAAHARRALDDDARAACAVADARWLPCAGDSVDIAVSALAYNFIPDRPAALQQMREVVRPSGTIALYVWDYPGIGVGFMNAFWDEAAELDPAGARQHLESRRFDFCQPGVLANEFRAAGLAAVETGSITIETVFENFDDLWRPFALGAGPAPAYCAKLTPEDREALRQRLKSRHGARGRISFPARAWTARGRVDAP